jgi:uncharacterized protein YigE (DUF2233 family)
VNPPTPRSRRGLLPLLAAVAIGTGAVLAAGLLSKRPIPTPHASVPGVICRHVTYAGHSFTIATVDLGAAELDLFWKRPDGSRYGSFRALRDDLSRSGRRLVFATNAGIFDPSFTPLGLHVEGGKVLVPLNTRDGPGNFYRKPNGVFLIDAGGDAHVVLTDDYADSAGGRGSSQRVRLATQSGPLLVRSGRLHPAFRPGSDRLAIRSGVGVASPRKVVFGLSDEPVNFDTFARLFRDELGCRDALYLDGAISRFDTPGLTVGGTDGDGSFAGILAAVGKVEK